MLLNTPAVDLLKQYYGYESFKIGQAELIEQIIGNHDVLAIMPTGAGKSVCYQIPALMKSGVAIVISPLISLMKNQVDALNELGIPATYINSSISSNELQIRIKNAYANQYKLIYVAPERLETEQFMQLIQNIPVSLIAIDEAHCVSQWGHDFRPSYLKIADMIHSLPARPTVSAFTATATPEVKQDIIRLLELKNPHITITGFDRENLFFAVEKPRHKIDFLLDYLSRHKNSSGIIYASTRKTVNSLCEKLNSYGFAATKYHAGLGEAERSENQEDYLYDRIPVMIATNAFGLGIDKSNTNFVIHNNMPKNIEAYYQEAGRAGRDGSPADCILLFSVQDIITNKILIENSSDNADKSNEYKKLQLMTDYCNTQGCLRSYILSYFGETDQKESCGNCGNCNADIVCSDITIEAQKILSCIKRMGERFGGVLVANVLRGANLSKIRGLGFDKLSTYGIMKDYPEDSIKEIIQIMIADGYISTKIIENFSVLALNEKSFAVLRSAQKVLLKKIIQKEQPPRISQNVCSDMGLFEILRSIRREKATEQNVPPFVIFADTTLRDMCNKYPMDENAMLQISGVGRVKLEKYGESFISAIKEYVNQNNITPPPVSFQEKRSQRTTKADVPRHNLNNKEPKQDTVLVTYELYKNGNSVEGIANIRGFSPITIEGHIYECIKRGLELEYKMDIPQELENQILQAAKTLGTKALRPIKDALPEETTYSVIKYVIFKYDL